MSRRKRAKKRKRRIFRIILLIVILAALAVYDSNTRIVTTEYGVSSERLPEAFDGFRVTQLSDLHEAYGDRLDYLVSKTEETHPDIIAVTGDLLDDEGSLSYTEELIPRLLEIAPVYYVTGNHEWPAGIVRELSEQLSSLGVTVLQNDYVLIERGGEQIILAGIDDPNGPADMETPPDFINRVRDAEGDKYMLLLVHRNDWLEKYSELPADCALSGHAHGGIVRLPFTDGLINTKKELFPSYTSGLYSENGTDMIVSRGLGNADRIFRLFNNPHIPVIVLEND